MSGSLRICLIAFAITLLAGHPVLSDNSDSVQLSRDSVLSVSSDLTPRNLTGFLDEQSAKPWAADDEALAKDDSSESLSPLAGLPVLDEKLVYKTQYAQADEILRLIVYLDYLPHAAVLQDALARHDKDVQRLEKDRRAFLARTATRDSSANVDALNYAGMFEMNDADREALRELNERNEALSGVIKSETTRELRKLIDADQAPVVAAIENLGGTVESRMIAGNTLVATMPAGLVHHLATVPGVMRVVEDSLMHADLNIADDASMVAATQGLWDNGYAGGIYDPAVIDSGTDLGIPGVANSGTGHPGLTNRSNWCAWYLVAGTGHDFYDDEESCDDLQGHGTHVFGIIGSMGSDGWTDRLGMAYGVDKMVSLKAAWRNSETGGASMYPSDRHNLVELALNDTDELFPSSTFGSEDIDGFNLSYGSETSADDTDASRFWDSVVSSYLYMPVTLSAGNSGPDNLAFTSPAVSYNAITVANFDDRNTASRADDVIFASSTVGPTAEGRRKPDIAAPGTAISSARHNWEDDTDYVDITGTSMAAPMVLGILMDLMEAGVFDELQLKALLLNTAQKNLPGMNFENNDPHGWHRQIGWGAINAWAAYYHRLDVHTDSVEPRNPGGNYWYENDYVLYKGSMRDEGSAGEGRDRATMAWNRVATYNPAAPPDTYYTLADLDLKLYQESDNSLIDFDNTVSDNVHQVRIGTDSGFTDVILKAHAYSTSFAHGGATQEFALATEENFTKVDCPAMFQGVGVWPSVVEPNEVFDITFWLRNESEIASHYNYFNLELPAGGWTLVAGTDHLLMGSLAAGAETAHVSYTLRAPPTAVGLQGIVIQHTHNSYGENYGGFNWGMPLTVGGAAATDRDGVDDSTDNCTNVFNPSQYDSNGDNIGSLCDADISGPGGIEDCFVNFIDLQAVKDAFFATPVSPSWNPDADLDNNSSINFADLQIVKSQLFGPPGPSAFGCN